MSTVTIPRGELLARLDAEHWVQKLWDAGGGRGCLHQHIRWCHPVSGDAYLIEQVTNQIGKGSVEWQDEKGRTLDEVRSWVAEADITDTDLELTFGANWQAVVALVRRAAILTPDEIARLAAAAAWAAAWARAGYAAWATADAVRAVATNAAGYAATNAAGYAAGYATDAVRVPTRYAARALVVADLIGQHGLTQDHLDTLLGPWRQVIGDPLDPATIQRWLNGGR